MKKVTKVAKLDPSLTILTRVLVILFQMMIIRVSTSTWLNSKVGQAWNNMSKISQSNGILSFHITVLVKGYLYQFDLHSGKKEDGEENLGAGVVLKITESLQNSHWTVFLIISSTVPHLLSGFMIEVCMVFAILKRTGKECRGMPVDRKMKAGDIEYLYSEKVAISSYKVAVSGLIGVP